MDSHVNQKWYTLLPQLPEREAERVYHEYAKELAKQVLSTESNNDNNVDYSAFLREWSESKKVSALENSRSMLRAAMGVLTDLVRQGWSVQVDKKKVVKVRRPEKHNLRPRLEKARIQEQELVKRNEQLSESSVQAFVRKLERKSIHKDQFVSILSLMRDGRELASSLRAVRDTPEENLIGALRSVIDPYLQFVHTNTCCEHTGIRLQDIWRYFRHTWTNQYKSTPGRTMAFLVRDKARKYHPVIGIGAIGSPIVQIKERDSWIGWHPQTFIEYVLEFPSVELGEWLLSIVDTAIEEIYVEDLFAEQLLIPKDIRFPSLEVINKLKDYGARQRELHHRLSQPREYHKKNKQNSQSKEDYWLKQTASHLYRSKRAISLADLLNSRFVLQRHLSSEPQKNQVCDLVADSEGRKVIKRVLRKARADRVGIAMGDIIVCGAVAPYSPVLGGKLVSMLAASPEVVSAYRDRYADQESVIASSMAGRPVIRPSKLVFLGTTSLYGVGSSQYNRLRMPAERVGGRHGELIEYIELGKSGSYGTSQFSSGTVDALVDLLQQSTNGQRVNSIFGEGVSPKLRKVRDGLDALNLPTEALLQHGRQRIVYGIPLVRNLRRYLLGMDEEPDYFFDVSKPEENTQEIASWWIERWLSMRIKSDGVLNQVEQHTLVSPVQHGACVALPKLDEDQFTLFSDLERDN